MATGLIECISFSSLSSVDNLLLISFKDQQDLVREIKEMIQKIDGYKKKLNTIVGFITTFKKDNYMVFKTKDLRKKRNKGARCDQTTKSVASNLLKEIYPDIFDIKKIKSIQLCILQELYLKLFNSEMKEEKIWFLSPVQSQLMNIENL